MYDAYLGPYTDKETFTRLFVPITTYTLSRCLNNQLVLNVDSKFFIYSIPAICSSIYSAEIEKVLSMSSNIQHQDYISFPNISLKSSKYLLSKLPSEITSIHLDPSKFVYYLLEHIYLSGMIWGSFYMLDQKEMLSEIALSFILFAHCYNFEGFDHWKALLLLISQSETFILENESFAFSLLHLLYDQISEFSTEKFNDIFPSIDPDSNLLVIAIKVLFPV